MQRPRQGANGRGHRRVEVGEGSGGHPSREGGGVELVVSVENQALIHDPRGAIGGDNAGEHVQKVGSQGQVVPGSDHLETQGRLVVGGDDRRYLGGEQDSPGQVCLSSVPDGARIVGTPVSYTHLTLPTIYSV